MWYRSIGILVVCSACVAPLIDTQISAEGQEMMKLDITFNKAGQPFDINKPRTASSLDGVVAVVSVMNDTQTAVTFPCAFLQEQGLAALYRLANRPDSPAYSIGTNPASFETRSNLTELASGQACQVEHAIVQEGISAVMRSAAQDAAAIELQFFVPQDPDFGTVSGRQITATVNVIDE